MLPATVALKDTILGTGDVAQFDEAGLRPMFERLVALHGYVRGYTDCFGHGLTIEGALGAMIEPALNPRDIRATQAIVEAAGGTTLIRRSRKAGKFDALFGNRALVRGSRASCPSRRTRSRAAARIGRAGRWRRSSRRR
jgi:fructose-1,6-bisphosphatase/inositol monophosphatase family enzyme